MKQIFFAGQLFSIAMLLSLESACSGAYDKSSRHYWDTAEQANPADIADDDNGEEPGAEKEDDFLALKPAQTDVYVFVANPDRDTVTRVNVLTHAVDTTDVGHDPSMVLTTPDYQKAVVFNRGDDSVTIVNANTLETQEVEVRDNFNNMVMSPDDAGEWVVLWHDIDAEAEDDPAVPGLLSYNEASFVNILTGAHFPMAVGFNPRAIEFTPDASVAVVVSDDYLTFVDLSAATPTPRLIEVAEDPVNPPAAEEVILAPDGTYAFVRQFGGTDLVVVDLLTYEVDRIPVGDTPTDLDLSPDGSMAALVARADEELWLFEVADPHRPAQVLDLPAAEGLGSLLFDPTGKQGILYTTATATDHYATWDVDSGKITVRSLVKPVSTMAMSPTGESLLAFHTQTNAVDANSTSPFHNSWALTMIDLGDFRTNPLKLPAAPTGYAHSTNGNFAFFIMEQQPFLEVLHFDKLIYDQVTLKSNPVFVGVLPDLNTNDDDEPPVWISQEHELGRITFYDADDGSLETITGFELNSHIED
ncbi:MAG: hypothetical protein HN348_02390 [Proteobacteria bacterium]|nr:hypothetical protein [Pseudomonadota bacterium]